MAQLTCTSVNYWIGSTTERFTISDSLINETSNLTIDPNSGTGGGIFLDFTWVSNNFNIVNKNTFNGVKTHSINTLTEDAHILIIVPTTIEVTGIGEIVLGTLALMTQGLHYDIFQILNGTITYNVYYLRDLTNFVFPKRQFQFDVVIA